jgi:hypothetical protein
MIAKRIASRAAKPRMARLVKYVVAAEGGLDPRSWARTADYLLCSKTNNRGEKVGGVRVTHCHTDDPAAATSLIEATQAANTRSKTDKTYHLVFSFPPGEEPPLEVLHKIEDELVRSIGYAEHQRVSAVHIDCDHLHVHVAINKVHPKGFQNIEPYFDKKKLMEACERLELEYGLTRTNHGLHGEIPKAKVKNRQAEAEIHGGMETLAGYVAREIAPKLKEAQTWQEAHALLSGHGLEIKQRGAGLVIGSGELWVKASQCDRSFSIKALTDRLGAFGVTPGEKPARAYEPKPRQNHPSSAALFDQYQREKMKAKIGREQGEERVKYESAVAEANLKRWVMAQKLFIQAAPKGVRRRAALKLINLNAQAIRRNNGSAMEKKRRQVILDTVVPGWATWLAFKARAGNAEAIAVLRSRRQAEAMRGNYLAGAKNRNPVDLVLQSSKPGVDLAGRATYNTPDGGVVIDRKNHVQTFRATPASILLALELANQRFCGQPLVVEGQEDFQKEVMKLARERGIPVRLAVKPRKRSIDREIQI